MKSHLLPCAAALALLFASAQADTPVHGIDIAAMDKSIAPGDDFYGYANGTWLKTTEIPADQSRWGGFAILNAKAQERTRDLIQTADAARPASRKIADYYASFLDEDGIEAKGLAPLKTDLAAIAAISNKTSLARALGATLRADVDPLNNTNFVTENLFGLWVAPGFNDSAHYTPYLLQGGLGMPAREYYLGSDAKSTALRAAYRGYVAKLLTLAGMADADAKADAILALETRIAAAQVDMVESQDVAKANNVWTRTDFALKAPGLDWSGYFAGARLNAESFIVWQPGAFTRLAAIVGDTPIAVWKSYLAFHRLNAFAPFLPKAFVAARFEFYGKTLSGTPVMQPRWKRGVNATNAAMGDAVGELYAAKYFTPQAKARAQVMVANIIAAMGRRIEALDWMSPATKAKAKEKLFGLYVGIGYPEKWRDYAGLDIVKGDALGNYARAELFEYRYAVGRIGAAVDKTEWHMTPQTVNAVNLPLQNALNFPAAILERPFYDPDAPDAYNYGAIGAVIGHEISHSFDNQGAVFDATGRLQNWWTPADFDHFTGSGARLAAQFDQYRPFPDLAVKGKQTLGENIADNAGLSASYDAWKMSLGGKPAPLDHGLTGDQQFFLANAQVWANKSREAALRQQVIQNEHAPGDYRALEARNMDAWYAAFAVKPGQKQYLAPADRVHVW